MAALVDEHQGCVNVQLFCGLCPMVFPGGFDQTLEEVEAEAVHEHGWTVSRGGDEHACGNHKQITG